MNCNCVKNVEAKGKEMKWKARSVLSAELQGILQLRSPNMEFFTSSTLTVELEGRKKKVEIEIRHTYCPFCGKKQEEEDQTAKENGSR